MKSVWKWMLVLGTLLLSIVIALVVMDVIGVWDVKGYALRRIETVPAVAPYVKTYRLGQENAVQLSLEQAELEARTQALEARRAELDVFQQELDKRAENLAALQAQVESGRQGLASARDAWAAQQLAATTRADRLAVLADAVGEMAPVQVGPFLDELDDETVADLLALVEPEVGAMILGALDPARASSMVGEHFLKPSDRADT